MTGKEQAKQLAQEMVAFRDDLWSLKNTFSQNFKRKSIVSLFNGGNIKEMGRYRSSYLGYEITGMLYRMTSNIVMDKIENMLNLYDNRYRYGSVIFDRIGPDGVKVRKNNLTGWNAQATFFIDHEDYYLRIFIKIKLANRWYRYELRKDSIDYIIIKPPKLGIKAHV